MNGFSEIAAEGYSVFVGENCLFRLQELLQSEAFRNRRIFVLADENTAEHCLPVLISRVASLSAMHLITVPAGEPNKTIHSCMDIWRNLDHFGAERSSVLINLGGGVIGDMGGFAAATYKRGIAFIQVPTTLLAQVDASVGGKTAVDLDGIKNNIGLFVNPEAVFADPIFFYTLPQQQLINGFAEMLKHGLIADRSYWNSLEQVNFYEPDSLISKVQHSIEIKNAIVKQDFSESGLRKILNFGHTIGHAIESFSLESDGKSLLHGEAIAVGMVCEAFISHKMNLLNSAELAEICHRIMPIFPRFELEDMSYHRIIELLRHDKKSHSGKTRFTLLKTIGEAVYDREVTSDLVIDSLNFYQRWTE